MTSTGGPETSVSSHQSTLSNISEERRSYVHRDGSLKADIKHFPYGGATNITCHRT